MNPITKAFVSNKLSSAEKSLGFGSKEDSSQNSGISAKEARKLEEEDAALRAKRQEQHDKRAAEREKKREEIREKYGLRKGSDCKDRRSTSDTTAQENETADNKNCCVM